MLFEVRFREGVQDGSITLTFRRWKRRQVVAGNRYRTAVGMLEVRSVDIVEPTAITDAEARRSGYPTARDLVDDLRGTADLPTYRIAFDVVRDADPRDLLAANAELSIDDVTELDRRLDRLDRASSHGAWTRATLQLVAAHPARRAGDLAEMVGRERESFKLDVRKLKNLGLTRSLEVGYRISPRGEAYLAAVSRRDGPAQPSVGGGATKSMSSSTDARSDGSRSR